MTKSAGQQFGSRVATATLILLLFSAISVAGQDLAADTRALIAFSNVHDPRGTKLHWKNTTWTCNWRGVTCTQNRVTELRLPGKGFRGTIPPETLSLISKLQIVSLRGNKLTGTFPGELGNCNNLESLFLAGNDFYGPLPDDLVGLWPRLTHMSLEFNKLNGTIPEAMGLFPNLYLLNLRNNCLTGSIPPFNSANLTVFNVANNNLSGAVPSTLSRFSAASYIGNPSLCGPPLASVCLSPTTSPVPASPESTSTGKRKRVSTGAVVGMVLGGVAFSALLAVGFLLCLCGRKKGKRRSAKRESSGGEVGRDIKGVEEQGEGYSSAGGGELERNKLVFFDGKQYSFNLEDLLRASAEVLGKGSVGTAYKAILEDGTIMAVKRLKDVTTGKKEFESQIHVVGTMQHPNLVPLRAFYFSKDEKLLVYDFMPMGSLSALLHGNRGSSRTPLDWVTRVKIALGAAKGLAYLHFHGGPKFVHANIKSSNILLNRELEACISDFGLTQLLTASSAASRIVGYRAPEVTETKKVTQKSDVYSFGVLLLELLTGKAPTQAALNDEGIDLPRWVQSVVREEWTAEVFDLELMRYQNIEEEMVAMLQIAMQCVDPVPERRPKMNNVLLLLEDVHPFFIDNGDDTSRQSESASEEKFRGSSDKDKTSQENTPSRSHTP